MKLLLPVRQMAAGEFLQVKGKATVTVTQEILVDR
jgi:hypothetical protein